MSNGGIHILAAFLLMPFYTIAQEEFNIDFFIQRALDSSHLLNADAFLLQRSQARNTNGYAGNLPSLVISGQSQYELNSSRLEFFDGGTTKANNASNYSAGAGIDLVYPFYEGGAKNIRKSNLVVQVDDAIIDSKIDQQNIILSVLQTASDVELYRAQINTFKKDTSYWNALLELRKKMMSYGKGTRVDLIQLQTEFNRSSTQLERARQQYEIASVRFRELTFWKEPDSIPKLDVQSDLQRIDLQKQADHSPLIDQAQNDIRISELDIELAKSSQLPVFSVFVGYGYNWSRNVVGILLNNQNFGPYAGLQLNWNIYDGHRIKTEIQSAQLQRAADRSNYNAVERDINYTKKRLRNALHHQQIILRQERKQLELLQTQFEIIQEQYRQGRIDVLQVLNFQRQLLLTQLNISNAEYEIRNYLIQILYWEGLFATAW